MLLLNKMYSMQEHPRWCFEQAAPNNHEYATCLRLIRDRNDVDIPRFEPGTYATNHWAITIYAHARIHHSHTVSKYRTEYNQHETTPSGNGIFSGTQICLNLCLRQIKTVRSKWENGKWKHGRELDYGEHRGEKVGFKVWGKTISG